jgi:2-polyprenyl-6-methoxyphenol hydroxylase-like FAD-dependent oxidoreductase
MTAVRNVLIVGGGIGGLTSATALRQQGIEVDIVEINKATSVYGVGIIQPNNTLRALDKIGLARACVDSGAPFPGWRIHDSAGNVLMDAPSTSDAAPGFPPNNGITRPRLHEILANAASDHRVPVQFGLTVDTLADDGDGVDVTFTDGRAKRYDLVLGCDGLFSTMRTRLFGDRFKPAFTGQSVWRYNLPRPADLEWGALFVGPNSKVGLVPLSPTLMYMLVVTSEPGNPRFEGDAMAEEMRKRLSHFTGHVAELGKMITDPAGVVYRPMESLLIPSPWGKGRVLLIGDAAHSTTPHLAQGAAMAIEDAVLLAELLGRDEPLSALLDEFMRRRFDRVKFVVDSSLQIGAWEMEEWQGIHSPGADPGGLLHSATLALMDTY